MQNGRNQCVLNGQELHHMGEVLNQDKGRCCHNGQRMNIHIQTINNS